MRFKEVIKENDTDCYSVNSKCAGLRYLYCFYRRGTAIATKSPRLNF